MMARPTLEEEAIRNHEKAHTRFQNAMAKSMGKAQSILLRLLDDIEASTNPANIGKKDKLGKDKYNPSKYKENTQIAVVKEVITNNKDFLKAQQDLKKVEDTFETPEDEDYTIELSLSSEDDEAVSKYN